MISSRLDCELLQGLAGNTLANDFFFTYRLNGRIVRVNEADNSPRQQGAGGFRGGRGGYGGGRGGFNQRSDNYGGNSYGNGGGYGGGQGGNYGRGQEAYADQGSYGGGQQSYGGQGGYGGAQGSGYNQQGGY